MSELTRGAAGFRPADDASSDRLPPLATSALSAEQRRAISEFHDARGWEIRGPFVPLLRSPQLLTRVRALGDYLRFESAVPPALRELAILIAARRWSQAYTWSAHYAIALEAGLSPATCDALALGLRPDGLSGDERAVFDLCAELLDRGEVSDEHYEAARSRLGEPALIDLVGLVGYYSLIALVLNAARTPPLAGTTHRLPAAAHGSAEP